MSKIPNDSLADKFRRDPAKEDEVNREARRRRAFERLGIRNPACVLCAENDPDVLELHHLEGQAYGNTLVPVCRNCHRKLSSLQKDHPDKIQDPPDPLERIGHFLLGLADLFEILLRKLREFARELIARADPNRDNLEPGQ